MFATEELLSHIPITSPTGIFLVVLCAILFAPIIFTRLRIPHIIGMILAGVILGPYGLYILNSDSSFEIFGKVGLYYIMFLAGLEMDVDGFRQNKANGAIFGLCTFLIPFGMGFSAGYWGIGLSFMASMLMACILSSHTLITYPTISRYGLNHSPSVTISIGATMIALIAALLVLAGISEAFTAGLTWEFWAKFPLKCAAFIGLILFFYPRWVRWFFRKYSDNVTQYVFVMMLVVMAAAIGDMIGLEGIFGAFLTGLVINRHIPSNSSLMTRIEFVGNALFIPYFLLSVGMIIDLRLLFTSWSTIAIVTTMVVVGTFSKYIAAKLTAYICHMNRYEGRMLFGLTEAHAAGALAMVMVGTRLKIGDTPLISEDILNGIVIMILCSCIISSFVTESAAKKLATQSSNETNVKTDDEKIIIPIRNMDNMQVLVDTALMTRNIQLNRGMIGLNVVFDDENSDDTHKEGQKILDKAASIAAAADVRMQKQSRLATNVANGILHALRENYASEMIMGLHNPRNERQTPTNFVSDIIKGTHQQVMLVRSHVPMNTIKRIHVMVPPKAEYEVGFHRWLTRMMRLATQMGARIVFYSSQETRVMIQSFALNNFPLTRTKFEYSSSMLADTRDWNEVQPDDHLLVFVLARRGTVSHSADIDRIKSLLMKEFTTHNLIIVYPDQYGHPEQRRAIRL